MLICPGGHFTKVVTIKDCNVDIVKDHCSSVYTSWVDPVMYLLYGTVTTPNNLSNSQVNESVSIPEAVVYVWHG